MVLLASGVVLTGIEVLLGLDEGGAGGSTVGGEDLGGDVAQRCCGVVQALLVEVIGRFEELALNGFGAVGRAVSRVREPPPGVLWSVASAVEPDESRFKRLGHAAPSAT